MTAGADPLVVNDVHSGLNETRVARIETPTSVDELVAVVQRAAGEDAAIATSGSRHAMGGQQFAADGVLIDMRGLGRVLDLDTARGLVTVEAGIEWRDLVAWLIRAQADGPHAWGIAQKQTGADRLSIGGALSANGHGRGLRMQPLVADVEAFTLVDAEGARLQCSRTEHPDLFALAIGGYGLFGIIADATLRLTPRRKVRRVVDVIDVDALPEAFEERIASGFLYGDFQFDIDDRSPSFLRRGVFACYEPVPNDTPIPAGQRELSEADWRRLLVLTHAEKREAYRQYVEHYDATNGQIYWSDTNQLGVYLEGYHEELDAHLGARVRGSELITELYVPRERLPAFLDDAATALRARQAGVIYGTVRLIERDDVTFLPWASDNWACTIFNLHVDHDDAGIERAREAFRDLIDAAIAQSGSYFLTYHRYARRDQVLACYPQFPEFLRRKRLFDPHERFQSEWYRHYREQFRDMLVD